jgi:deoxycytidylate deaminase
MSNQRSPVLVHPDAELVFGLVAPLGVNLNSFIARLEDELKAFSYSADVTRLSGFLEKVEPKDGSWKLIKEPEGARIDSHMTGGDLFRRGSGRNDVLALMAAADVARRRDAKQQVFERCAQILVSLKHPEEVLAMRQIYGAGFFLIGLYTPEAERLRHLCDVKGIPTDEAKRLMKRDDEEPLAHGQQARDAFQLSDVFIRVDQPDELDRGLARFLDLVFGNPRVTPTSDEHAMFLAFAASSRSAALGRQVGAVILSEDGDVLAVGANDVPSFGGGQYWPGSSDQRDHQRGHDSNATQREEIVRDIARRLVDAGIVDGTDKERLRSAENAVRESRLLDITEYGREVHAEMEALLSCARSGGRTRNGSLFTTTFPCHNCAKHIVGAGLSRVAFVEPYPKSKAFDLHDDALTFDYSERDRKVLLQPFVGVGPRRYLDLFTLRLGIGSPLDRKVGNMVAPWRKDGASPRVQMMPMSYLEKERLAEELVDPFWPGTAETKGAGS